MNPSDGPDTRDEQDDLEQASENVLGGWPSAQLEDPPADPVGAPALEEEDGDVVADAQPVTSPEPAPEPEAAAEPAPEEPEDAVAPTAETTGEHAPGDLAVPPGYPVLEGEARGARRAVGVVVSRFNGEVTGGLLESALEELEACGVERESVTVMPVPGAFELPLAAMALAKTRRFACIVALGCVIRGDTPHFDYVASEAASGLQLAAIETGVPVSFGVLTLDRPDQAEPRLEKGAEAVRTALEMADLFANLRAAAAR
jgi:6,7-dimethyl-8-ribityllumazine synthase